MWTREYIFQTTILCVQNLSKGAFYVKLKEVDLAIFMGQSNMAGRGDAKDATVCEEGHGFEYRAVTSPDRLFKIEEPFGKMENNDAVNDTIRSGDMVSSLMESYYEKTKRPIVGVACSCGGTDTSYWTDDLRKNESQQRLLMAKKYLLDNCYTINKIFMVWCQGESDADRIYRGDHNIEDYKKSTLQVFEYMKEVGVNDIFVVKTGHFNGLEDVKIRDEAYMKVHKAQDSLALENENIHIAGSFLSYKDKMRDEFHYHQSAYNEVGDSVGRYIAEFYFSD